MTARVGSAAGALLLLATPAAATSWMPRPDVGVAAVETRTGRVLWEAWRPAEIPAPLAPAASNAVLDLLDAIDRHSPAHWRVPPPPQAEAGGLAVRNPWPRDWADKPLTHASVGARLLYRHDYAGVVAFERLEKREAWRLPTTRFPYVSQVREAAGGDVVFVQIGSDVPLTLQAALGLDGARMRGLGPVSPRLRAAAALLLAVHGDGYQRPKLRGVAENVRASGDPNAAAWAAAVTAADAAWPWQRDRGRLFDGCVASVLGDAAANPFGKLPPSDEARVLAWSLLQELLHNMPTDGFGPQGQNYAYHHGWHEEPVRLADDTRARLTDHCRRVVADGPEWEKPYAASMLLSTAVGWDRLTDAERRGLFRSENGSVWRWALLKLVKNGRRAEVMAWAADRPAGDHLDVLWALRNGGDRPWPADELAFALGVAGRDPGGVASLLQLERGPAPAAFRGVLRAYLKREVAAPTMRDGNSAASYGLSAALRVLNDWADPADVPLLLRYLRHPLRELSYRGMGTILTEFWHYRLRDHARHMLEWRGVPIPPGVVTEEPVGPGNE